MKKKKTESRGPLLYLKPHMEQRIEIQETDDKNMVPKPFLSKKH